MFRAMKNFILILLCFISLFVIGSCSINDMIADALSSGMGQSFTGEDDPELVGDALPFALKLYDSILENSPHHVNLLLATGSAYIMYANAWVQAPAEMLPLSKQDENAMRLARAKRLYLRGYTMVMKALEVKYPGFEEALKTEHASSRMLERCMMTDVPLLYWSCAGLFAAYSTDPFDLELGLRLSAAVRMMERAYLLDPAFNNGSIPDFFISYHGSMPVGMGGDDTRALEFFNKTVELSNDSNPACYVSYALSVLIRKQDREGFREMLEKALTIEPGLNPQNRLAVIITQKKARWYLDHIDDFFI